MTRPTDPTTSTGGTCDGCDAHLSWGGMAWVPHTEAHHAARRRLTLRAVHLGLLERLGVRLGHRIRLRFTANVAWTECTGCDWSGAWVPGSAAARLVGRLHVIEAARTWLNETPEASKRNQEDTPTKGSNT